MSESIWLLSCESCAEQLNRMGLNVSAAWIRGECVDGRLPCIRSEPDFILNMHAVRECLATRAAFAEPPKGGDA